MVSYLGNIALWFSLCFSILQFVVSYKKNKNMNQRLVHMVNIVFSSNSIRMNISEIPGDIKLSLPKFNCDQPLGDIPSPIPCQHFYMTFVAPPRSGKTSTAISLLTTKTNKKTLII